MCECIYVYYIYKHYYYYINEYYNEIDAIRRNIGLQNNTEYIDDLIRNVHYVLKQLSKNINIKMYEEISNKNII